LWATPSVKGNYNKRGLSARSGDGLATQTKAWPTLTTHDDTARGGGKKLDGRRGEVLTQAVRAEWPTPSATSYGSNRGGAAGRTGPDRPSLATLNAPLNPAWVIQLMGFPDHWLDVGQPGEVKRSTRGKRLGVWPPFRKGKKSSGR
jgi:hypothetical protein